MGHRFQSHAGITSIEGLGHLRHVSGMAFCLAGCASLAELDMRGFSPASLTDLTYAFSGCRALTTIWCDAGWALPAGVGTYQTFHDSPALVGGNGTAWSAEAVSDESLRIDREGEPGYMTAL